MFDNLCIKINLFVFYCYTEILIKLSDQKIYYTMHDKNTHIKMFNYC